MERVAGITSTQKGKTSLGGTAARPRGTALKRGQLPSSRDEPSAEAMGRCWRIEASQGCQDRGDRQR
eukprot:4727283-Pyramimonas_sp.AAC.1